MNSAYDCSVLIATMTYHTRLAKVFFFDIKGQLKPRSCASEIADVYFHIIMVSDSLCNDEAYGFTLQFAVP